MKTKYIKIKEKKEFKEYIYGSNEEIMGYIYQDYKGDYLFKKKFWSNLGLGKCLKEIAERLIELNYKK